MRATKVKVTDQPLYPDGLLEECLEHLQDFGHDPTCCGWGAQADQFITLGVIGYDEGKGTWVLTKKA